jgi:uncharacterized membrane protein
MLEDLIGIVAIVVLVVVAVRQQQRLRVLEFDLDGLRKAFLAHREWVEARTGAAQAPAAAAAVTGIAAEPPAAAAPAATDAALPEAAAEPPAAAAATARPAGEAAPPATAADAAPEAAAVPPARPSRPTVETALGTRWAVWVGGLALALGGIFLVRYTIEAGIFGPELRLILAAILGAALVAAGEVVRRFGFRTPVEGAAGAYVPGILTAAGAFVLFGTVYAAHAIYGFIGPSSAFVLLGAIGIATTAASLVHGQALAGVGVVGSYVAPLLVSTQSPNQWALFGFIAVVLAAAVFIARLRDWALLAGAAFAGTGIWTLLYVASARPVDFAILSFITVVTLAVLEFVWLGRREADDRTDLPSVVPAFFVALISAVLLVDPEVTAAGGVTYGTIFLVVMVLVAVYRAPAVALLHAAGAATAIVFLRNALSGTFGFPLLGEAIVMEGLPPSTTAEPELMRAGIALGATFLLAGFWSAWRFASPAAARAAAWAAWGAGVPLVVLFSHWLAFGNPERDTAHAAVALALALALAAAGELVARAETPPSSGGDAVSFALAGSGVALLFALHMGFSPGWTTVLLGAAAVLPALAALRRPYPVLGWLGAGAAAAVLVRFAVDPTIVGAANLSRTPVWNWLLAGYGVPALGAAAAAWLLARSRGERPYLVMQAAAAFFALIGAAMLTRHAMHGGVIDAAEVSLAEQAVYTLIALAAGGILIALDRRAPGPVFRVGAMAVGVLSAAMVLIQHFLALDPLFTDESTGANPVFNLLFMAYLLPALAAGGLALLARSRRPYWYVALLALLAALLVFAYASLSLRRFFQGEFIGEWRGFGQIETWAYSALWLLLGVALLVGGLALRSQVLRLASAALIVVSVAKVFLFDMSELEGVLRALSFIGLGVVLIGIGLFYQRMLRLGLGGSRSAPAGAEAPPAGS